MEFLEFSEGYYFALWRCLGKRGVEVTGAKPSGESSRFLKFSQKIKGKTLTLIKIIANFANFSFSKRVLLYFLKIFKNSGQKI